MNLKALHKLSNEWATSDKMPVLFLGHGSPMNAIEENEFVKGFRNAADQIPVPRVILCISAHWETKGTFVTAMDLPKTIHDFYGFPRELYQVHYPAPGYPDMFQDLKEMVRSTNIHADHNWGLDHGTWSVVRHMYPDAEIPVVQLSLDRKLSVKQHYELAQELAVLRKKGVLIIGSGNMIHNLGRIAWDKMNEPEYAYDWAEEVNEKLHQFIRDKNHPALINYKNNGSAFNYAIPTPEHYLPLLYVLALQENNDGLSFFNDKTIGGSIGMTSLRIF